MPAFENVKGQIGYCGLWCGSCLVGNGTLNQLARECGKAVSDYGVNDWGPKSVDYDALMKGLSTIASMDPCPGCLKGGGRTGCEMRGCAKTKGLVECVDCGTKEACENRKILQHMRSGALGVGMKVKNQTGGRSKLIRTWTAELKKD
ncbi:MAG TPA: DUF3795 domain-containing protein [Thermoplasmata archaeon]